MRKSIAVVLMLTLLPVTGIIPKPVETDNRISETSSYEKESPEGTQAKKNHWFGKVVLWTLVIAAVGVAVYFLIIKKPEYKLTVTTQGVTGFPAAGEYTYKKGTQVDYNFSPQPGYKSLTVLLDGNPIAASGKIDMNGDHTLTVSALEVGNYTSITVQIHFLLKGLHAGGYASVYFDKKQFALESFTIFKLANTNSTCADAELITDKTENWTITKTSLECSQIYSYGPVELTPPFLLCPDLQVTVVGYTWESGKADPGTPILKNPQDIVFDKNKICVLTPAGSYYCESLVTLEFEFPPDPTKAQRTFVVGGCR